jgi:hypothetical protein
MKKLYYESAITYWATFHSGGRVRQKGYGTINVGVGALTSIAFDQSNVEDIYRRTPHRYTATFTTATLLRDNSGI